MAQHRLMTEREKADIYMQAWAHRDAGREEEMNILLKSIPMPSFLAKIMKEKVGADFLINGGWNLAEAEVEFGPGWLTR